MKVCEILAAKRFKKLNTYGIEIETEGENIRYVDSEVWKTEEDGSLRPRGGYPNRCAEFVLRTPIPYGAVADALNQLKQEQVDAVFDMSYRTSVHVHMNTLEMEEEQLYSLIYLYYIFENALVRFCGEDRVGNRFCLRIQDADTILDLVNTLFTKGLGVFTRSFGENEIRYSALNLASLYKYGSVEFRSMRGTVDMDTIHSWVSMLEKLRLASEKYSVNQIYTKLVKEGVLSLAEEVFGELYEKLRYHEFERDVYMNISLTISLAHVKRFVTVPKKPLEAPKHEDEFLMIIDEINNQPRPRVDPWPDQIINAPRRRNGRINPVAEIAALGELINAQEREEQQ